MNSCEKMQIAKINLRPGRGRDLKTLTDIALRELRAERKCYGFKYDVVDEAGGMYNLLGQFGSLRQARFWQLRVKALYGLDLKVLDTKTLVRIF